MAIKLEINITNKWLYSLIAVGILLALGVGVYAYQSNMRAGNPSVMGHSAGEINVENSAGEIVSLQDALDDLGTGSSSFGDWEARNFNVVYQASRDGFVVGWMGGNTYPYVDVFVGSGEANVSSEVVGLRRARFANWNGYSHPNNNVPFGIMIPVPKGQYWKVSVKNAYTSPSVQSGALFFLPA